ncbi:glycoside hydrolase family protein [Salipiger abyssi]|uniref:Lysozyme n=1 Tax=Salipiger abyssi TaxID=1250539 RepID=A0A1P8UP92_9RHOB|nr:hypothetical protein [Salipiger abyssi]APZ51224.1 Gene Transfer Agent tail protein [Salipiger abyssi]
MAEAVERTERIRILLDLEKDAHDREARAAAREIVRLEKAYDPLSRAVEKQERAMRRLSKQFDAGKIDAQQFKRLQDGIQREYDQSIDKANRFTAALAANNNAHGGLIGTVTRNKAAFQQLGYQVGDAAVQIQGGTSAITALTQQGSQLLGVMGPYGAIAGAVLAIGAPLAAAFFAAGDEAESAADKQKGLNEATDAYADAAEAARRPLADLREEYGSLADEMQRAFEVTKELAGVQASRRLQSAADDIAEGMGSIAEFVPGADDDDGQAAYQVAKTFRRIRREFDLTEAQAQDVMSAFRDLSRAEGPEDILAAAQALQALMITLAGSVEAAGDQFGETFTGLADLIENAAKQTNAGITETERLLRKYADAESDVMRLGRERSSIERELQEATEAADEARVRRAEKALEVLDAEILKTFELKDALREMAEQAKGAFDWLSKMSGLDISGMMRGVFDGIGDTVEDWMTRAEGTDAAKALIREREGFRTDPYWDVNHWRAGYGSDTATDAEGNVRTVTQGSAVSFEDAERDLERRISGYFNTLIDRLGFERFNDLEASQQAALASLLHNYGEGELRQGGDLAQVLEALNGSNDQLVAQRIAELGSHNNGVNRDRRREEARAFGDPAATIAAQDARSKAQKEADREAEKADKDRARALKQSKEAWDGLLGSMDPILAAQQKYNAAVEVMDEAVANGQATLAEGLAARSQLFKEYGEQLEGSLDAEISKLDQAVQDGESTVSEALDRRATLIERYSGVLEGAHRAELAAISEAERAGEIGLQQSLKLRAEILRDYQDSLAGLKGSDVEINVPDFEPIKRGYEGLTQALLDARRAGESVGDALRSWILDATLQAALRDLVDQLANMSGQGGVMGGIGSFFSWAFGDGAAPGTPARSAKGNAFASSGQVQPFAKGGAFTNSIVSTPTLFRMGDGKLGEMGEAGPEAVMPLARKDGRLSVRGDDGSLLPLTRVGGILGVSMSGVSQDRIDAVRQFASGAAFGGTGRRPVAPASGRAGASAVPPVVSMPVNIETLAGTTAEVTQTPDGGMNIRMVRRFMREELASGSMDSAMRRRWGGRPLPKGS